MGFNDSMMTLLTPLAGTQLARAFRVFRGWWFFNLLIPSGWSYMEHSTQVHQVCRMHEIDWNCIRLHQIAYIISIYIMLYHFVLIIGWSPWFPTEISGVSQACGWLATSEPWKNFQALGQCQLTANTHWIWWTTADTAVHLKSPVRPMVHHRRSAWDGENHGAGSNHCRRFGVRRLGSL